MIRVCGCGGGQRGGISASSRSLLVPSGDTRMKMETVEALEARLSTIEQASELQMNRRLAEMQAAALEQQQKVATTVRKQYDSLRETVNRKQRQLEELQAELDQVGRSMTYKSGADVALARSTAETETRLQESKEEWETAQRKRETYQFMATRLKDQTTTVEVALKELQQQSVAAHEEAQAAMLELHANKQERAQAESVANQLEKKLQSGRASREKKLRALEASIEKERTHQRIAMEREQRRQEIARLAQGDLQEEEEDRLKQLFLVRRAYCGMLVRRINEEERKTDELENAFTRIRGATGETTVPEIIGKFNDREKTRDDLVAQCDAARTRIKMLNEEQEKLQSLIDQEAYTGVEERENRGLYQQRDDYDRRLQEARLYEAERKKQDHHVRLILEECRTCIAHLLEMVNLDWSAARKAGKPLRRVDEEGAANVGVELEVDEAGRSRVPTRLLTKAIGVVDEKLNDLMTVLAVMFEAEDQKLGKDDGTDVERSRIRPLTPSTAKEVLSVVEQLKTKGPRGQLANYPSAMSISTADMHQTPDTLAALRSTMSSLADKASVRVYRSMMDIDIDTTARNVRVPVTRTDPRKLLALAEDSASVDAGVRAHHSASMKSLGRTPGRPAVSPIEGLESQDEDEFTEEEEEADARLGSPEAVVERHKIKRLSAMMSDRRKYKRARGQRRRGDFADY